MDGRSDKTGTCTALILNPWLGGSVSLELISRQRTQLSFFEAYVSLRRRRIAATAAATYKPKDCSRYTGVMHFPRMAPRRQRQPGEVE
jgi:hypothetical protein